MMFRVELDNFQRAMMFNEGPVFLVESIDKFDLYTTINKIMVVFTYYKKGDEDDAIFFESYLNKTKVIRATIEPDERNINISLNPKVEVQE